MKQTNDAKKLATSNAYYEKALSKEPIEKAKVLTCEEYDERFGLTLTPAREIIKQNLPSATWSNALFAIYPECIRDKGFCYVEGITTIGNLSSRSGWLYDEVNDVYVDVTFERNMIDKIKYRVTDILKGNVLKMYLKQPKFHRTYKNEGYAFNPKPINDVLVTYVSGVA